MKEADRVNIGDRLPDGTMLTESRKYVIESGHDHYWRFHSDEKKWSRICP